MTFLKRLKGKPLKEQVWIGFLMLYFIFSITASMFELFYIIATGKRLAEFAIYKFLDQYHFIIVLSAIIYSVVIFLIAQFDFKRFIERINVIQDKRKEELEVLIAELKVKEIELCELKNVADDRLAEAIAVLKISDKTLDNAQKLLNESKNQ